MLLLSGEFGVPIFKRVLWRQNADAVFDFALKKREADAELAAAMQRIGEFTMEIELLRNRPAWAGCAIGGASAGGAAAVRGVS